MQASTSEQTIVLLIKKKKCHYVLFAACVSSSPQNIILFYFYTLQARHFQYFWYSVTINIHVTINGHSDMFKCEKCQVPYILGATISIKYS